MQINILSVTQETIPTAKGSYDKLELAFKDETGTVKGKKIMSFGDSAVAFKALKDAKQGEFYQITAEKQGEFWVWTKVSKDTGNLAAARPELQSKPAAVGGKVTGSNYETPEERAKKQVYIVRQSSISNAIEFLTKNSTTRTVSEVLQIAKEFETHVFAMDPSKAATQELLDMANDIPL